MHPSKWSNRPLTRVSEGQRAVKTGGQLTGQKWAVKLRARPSQPHPVRRQHFDRLNPLRPASTAQPAPARQHGSTGSGPPARPNRLRHCRHRRRRWERRPGASPPGRGDSTRPGGVVAVAVAVAIIVDVIIAAVTAAGAAAAAAATTPTTFILIAVTAAGMTDVILK